MERIDETFDEASEFLAAYLLPNSTAKSVTAARATAESLAEDLCYEQHIEDREEDDEDELPPVEDPNQLGPSDRRSRASHTLGGTDTLVVGDDEQTAYAETAVVDEEGDVPHDEIPDGLAEEGEETHENLENDEGDMEGDDAATRHRIVYAEDAGGNVTAEDQLLSGLTTIEPLPEENEELNDGDVNDDDDARYEAERIAELFAEDADDGEENVEPDSDVEVDERTAKANAADRGPKVPPAFALSRLKNLFKYAESSALRATRNPKQTFSLSTDGALALSEALQLFMEDLATCAITEASRQNRKTVSYEDIALQAYQLDRFAFAADLIPMATSATAPRVAPSAAVRQERTATTAGPRGPEEKGGAKGPRGRPPQNRSAPPPAKDGRRQQTLSFAPKPPPQVK